MVSGELKQWHKVTLFMQGPFAKEKDNAPNPFTDCRFSVRFRHESGTPNYTVPGYFAADGDAATSSADEGTIWRAHLSPDKAGEWTYTISFRKGSLVAFDHEDTGSTVAPYDGRSGSFQVGPSDKSGRDLRGEGRLQYVGKHYLRFAGSGRHFVKAGADAPETLLGCQDFDGTVALKEKRVPLKTWAPHVKDWREGDPTWQGGKGKGLIGAINYSRPNMASDRLNDTGATRQRFLLVLLLFFHTVNAYMDRVCISAAKRDMQADINGLTDQMIGYAFGIFAIGYALFQVPSGWFSDQAGPRRALTIVVVIWSIFTALSGAVHTAIMLLVVRFLFGVGEAGAYSGATRALYGWLPANERGIGQGIFHSGARVGAALSLVVMPPIINAIGWRWTFVANAAVTALHNRDALVASLARNARVRSERGRSVALYVASRNELGVVICRRFLDRDLRD